MDIINDAYYSANESAEIIGWSVRKIQRRAKKDNIRKIDGRYLFTGHQLKEFIKYDTTTPTKDAKRRPVTDSKDLEDLEGYVTETFSPEEYNELTKLIHNEPLKRDKLEELVNRIKDYKNEITYLRKSLDSKDAQMNELITSVKKSLDSVLENQKIIQQRNFIELKDKNYETP